MEKLAMVETTYMESKNFYGQVVNSPVGAGVVVDSTPGKPLRLASSICWGVSASLGQQICKYFFSLC